jgi:hypothetical protein
LTKDDLTCSKRDLFLLFALSLPAGLLFFTCAATVVTRYHSAVKPTLLAEQWSYHLPYVESENVEMEDVHGNRFRLDFALAVSNGKWPFCTGQISVPIEGARTALFCKRKINNVECLVGVFIYFIIVSCSRYGLGFDSLVCQSSKMVTYWYRRHHAD